MLKITNYIKNTDATELIEFCSSVLNITIPIELILINNDSVLKKFDTNDFELQALLYKTNVLNTYQLIIRTTPSESIEKIIAHEMVHLNQYASGDLDLNINTKTFTWKGKKYNSSIDYFSRPWEKEAFKKQSELLSKYRKYKRQMKSAAKKAIKNK